MSVSVLSCPRILVAGLSGGSGKTIVSLGLASAFSENGLSVQTFKKGPDYIDAKWLSLASKSITTNLDPFLLSQEDLVNLFWRRAVCRDVALIEGNRGLYDGKDVVGSCSSAELAKSLATPVIVVADCTKVTRTMAAVILGLTVFDSTVDIRGVILNRTAGCRHQNIVRDAIEKYTDVQVLGVLPKLHENPIPERHMGLVSDAEYALDPFHELARFMREHVNLDACLDIARSAPSVAHDLKPLFLEQGSPRVRIGVVKDAALWFYYQENLDALRAAGAEIVEFSLLDETRLPDVDGLYLGGGFPETLAQRLADNVAMRESVRAASALGMPIYAECGGLMFLGGAIEYLGRSYPMAGVYPVTTKVFSKPQGHGYTSALIAASNPFFSVGMQLTGHEFHYSRCLDLNPEISLVFQLERGQGMRAGGDGLLHRNTLAGYTHTHALGIPSWSMNFVAAASIFQACRARGEMCPDIRLDSCP